MASLFIKSLTSLALLFLITACSSPYNERPVNNARIGSNTHAINKLANEGDLSMFYHALLNTGVASELNENTEYAIFAPTNAAFSEIQPYEYPCFYATQCRDEVAAVLRNHIVPRNENLHTLTMWGSNPIPTIGNRGLYVEEPYKNDFSVDGHGILYQSRLDRISLYRIDGVIINGQELAQFRAIPTANITDTVTEKTVTTYSSPIISPTFAPVVPGGHPNVGIIYNDDEDGFPDDAEQSTTIIHTTTVQ